MRHQSPGDGTLGVMTRLLLARHAETVWHAENRYAGGRSEPELTEVGVRQAAQLAKAAVAQGVDVVVSSPQLRALTTATPAAEALAVSLVIRPDLREIDFGALEGRTLDEMDPDAVLRFRDDAAAGAFPGAEPLADAGERCAAALRDLAATYDGTVLVVAHSSLFRVTLCTLLGLPPGQYRHLFPYLVNAALTEIALPADPARPSALIALNSAP